MKTLITVVGPTASGKTSLSIEIARQLNCEIISADSRQFYKEMNVGTAKPSTAEMHGIPHHFIDFISVKDEYNAGKYETDVVNFLEHYFQKKNVAILVGGSGLYVNAVCNGMDEIPPSDKNTRQKINEELRKNGLEYLLKKLKILDEKYYHEADKNNPHRIIRALEVCIISGVSYSSFRKKESYKKRNFNIQKIGLEISREILYQRINKRTDEMIKNGLAEEAEKLFPLRNLNALKTVGYEELFQYFEHKFSLEKSVELIKQNTRRFAKRQITWFKKDKETANISACAF